MADYIAQSAVEREFVAEAGKPMWRLSRATAIESGVKNPDKPAASVSATTARPSGPAKDH
jgi:hypothetical protein